MSIKESLPTLVRVVSYWVLFGMFVTGAVIMNFFIWAPQALTGRISKYSKAMGPMVANTPPYSWLGFSVEQLMIFGTIVDIAGLFGLFNWPKLSAWIVFASTAWRQFFTRMNITSPNMPNNPLCGYMSPHCLAVDLVHLGVLLAGVMVFTSPLPMPETNLLLCKQLGINTRWLDKGLSKFRDYMPMSMTPTPIAHVMGSAGVTTMPQQPHQPHAEGIPAGGTKKNL